MVVHYGWVSLFPYALSDISPCVFARIPFVSIVGDAVFPVSVSRAPLFLKTCIGFLCRIFIFCMPGVSRSSSRLNPVISLLILRVLDRPCYHQSSTIRADIRSPAQIPISNTSRSTSFDSTCSSGSGSQISHSCSVPAAASILSKVLAPTTILLKPSLPEEYYVLTTFKALH